MQVKVQKLSPVLVECSVEVDADRVKSEVEKAYASLSRSAKIKGFRPGRAPRNVLTHLYGRRIASDVAKQLVDETFRKAVSDQNLQPLNAPAIEREALEANKAFLYRARFEVVPEITEVKYEGLPAKREAAGVTPEQVDAEIERLREANATLEAPGKQRPAKKGDVVLIDLDVSVAGKPVEDAAAQDYQAELGSGSLLQQIDDALTGANVKDRVEVEVDMPAQHPHAKLRGKIARFSLLLKDLKEKVLPVADDEFAKDLGDYDSLEQLKNHLLERLQAAAKEQADSRLAEALVRELVKVNDIEVPPSLLEQQLKVSEQAILSRARAQGQKATGLGDELRARLLAESELKVKAGLLMAEIAKKEGIKIGDAEIEEGLKELAEQTGKNIAKLRAEYRGAEARQNLVGMILENKVLDIMEARAKIDDEPATAEAT